MMAHIDEHRRLTFGKWKGFHMDEMLVHHYRYLEWCVNNVNGFPKEMTEAELDRLKYKIAESQFAYVGHSDDSWDDWSESCFDMTDFF